MKFRIVLLVLLAGVLNSCGKSLDDVDAEALERNETVLARVASNIGFFRDLAVALEGQDLVASAASEESAWTVYWDNGRSSTVWPDPSLEDAVPPTVSAEMLDDRLVWAVNGEVLTAKGGRNFLVTEEAVPTVATDGPDWAVSVAGQRFTYKPEECKAAKQACVRLDMQKPVTFRLSSGTEIFIEKPDWYDDLRTRDVNRAFYKDIFLDAGVGLTERKSLAAAKLLGLSLEGMTGREDANREWQQRLVGGSAEDTNGRLLYPDGQPRYRVLFVNGGVSTTHGMAMGETVLSQMRTFFRQGGSYVGTCAGGFFASSDKDCFLSLWPGIAAQTGISGDYTDFTLEAGCPLLKYYDFGNDSYIEKVRHNGGCYAESLPTGTEVLARYVYPSSSTVDGQPSVWAYKPSTACGRAVLTGGHPEEVTSGEKRDLTAAMIRYAMDGQGTTPLKAILRNGRTQKMSDAGRRIGDLQCHHFAFWVPKDAGTVEVSVEGQTDCAWALSLSQEGFAYPDTAPFVNDTPEFRAELAPGIWYLSVRCMTTVDVKETETGQTYSGRTDVLNGVPYSVVVKWEEI